MTRVEKLAEEYGLRFGVIPPLCDEERECNAEVAKAIGEHYLAGYAQAIEDAAKVAQSGAERESSGWSIALNIRALLTEGEK